MNPSPTIEAEDQFFRPVWEAHLRAEVEWCDGAALSVNVECEITDERGAS